LAEIKTKIPSTTVEVEETSRNGIPVMDLKIRLAFSDIVYIKIDVATRFSKTIYGAS